MEIKQQVKLEELEKRLNSLNKRISSQSENLIELNTEFQNIGSEINNLSTTIDELGKEIENMPAGGSENVVGNYNSIYSCFDKIVCSGFRHGSNTVRNDRIFFICKPGVWTKIKIKTDIFFKSTKQLDGYFAICLNGKAPTENRIYEENYEYNGEFSKTIEFEYEFFPTKENNMLLILVHPGEYDGTIGSAGFTYLETSIFGQNVMILTRRNEFKVFITKDNYYITKNLEDGSYYKVFPSSNIDLSQEFTKIGDLKSTNSTYNNRISYFNVVTVPEIVYNSTTQKHEFTEDLCFYFVFTYNGVVYYGKENPGAVTMPTVVSYGPTYNVAHPISTGTYPYNLASCYTLQGCYCYTTKGAEGTKKSSVRMKLNSVNLEGDWIDNYCAFAKDWEDNFGLRPSKYIATNDLGEIYFFPESNSTYNVYIGKGCQVNAYMQSDLSINVYYRWFGEVHKKVLKINEETGQYELQPEEEIFSNAFEVIEGFGSDYFINRYGEWEYINN